MSNDYDPESLQQPNSEDNPREKLGKDPASEPLPTVDLERQLRQLRPRFDDALTSRTLYEAGLRAGRNARRSSTLSVNGRLLAGFATGVAATLLAMQFIDRQAAKSAATVAFRPQQTTPAPRINAFAQDAVHEDAVDEGNEQPLSPPAALDLSALLEQTLAKRMNYDNSSLRERFLRGDFETVAAKPTLTYGQWIQTLNRGDTSLLD